MRRRLPMILLASLTGLGFTPAFAQFGKKQVVEDIPDATVVQNAPERQAGKPAEIADEPKTIDPATLVPKAIAKKATVQFTEATLKEVVKWLQEEQGLNVLVNQQEILSDGGSLNEPITDRLDDAPIYLLLNRLRKQDLDWYLDENVLRITTIAKAQEHMSTIPYLIGDLLDAGYKPRSLMHTIRAAAFAEWEDEEGVGGRMILLGDVLFVRQPAEVQRQINGLLAALRKPARRTFVSDEPVHGVLREKLQQPATINVEDKPLTSALAELSKSAEIDIRLDKRALRERQIRERTLVTLKLENQKLATLLQALVGEWDFTWTLEDGVLWITSHDVADRPRKTAVFDVRDLCRDERESAALQRAILGQTSAEWAEEEGVGGTLSFAKPGILVVRQSEGVLEEVLQLLENYRAALRASKPRVTKDLTSQEMVTRFYRLPSNVADDLEHQLAQLVRPETWNKEGVSVRKLVSRAEAVNDVLVPHSVLMIRQMREVHEDIWSFIQKLETGETPAAGGQGMMGGMGGGMGGMGGGMGFGGGFFSLPEKKPLNQPGK